MSSAIWNSTPNSLAKLRKGIVAGPSAIPPNSSTHSTEAPIRRPVFSSCRRRSAAGPGGVPGKNPLVLAKLEVARGLPAAQIVVVHRRQVIVDQRVGVDQLDRARQRQ